MMDFPYSKRDIVKACIDAKANDRKPDSIAAKVSAFKKIRGDWITTNHGDRFSQAYLDYVMSWHNSATIRHTEKAGQKEIDLTKVTLFPADEPNPAIAATINFSRENANRIRIIESAGGNASAYINKLIAADFGA